MKPFAFAAATTVEDALRAVAAGATPLTGGTTLVDLMKLEVLTPRRLVDINALPLRDIVSGPDGVRIGAVARMRDVAADPRVAAEYPVVAEALLLGASQQLRSMASIGGNLMQRTRCGYFRDSSSPCNRRDPGTGCPAAGHASRMHAILGISESCSATHPGDLAVALVALDATVRLRGPGGTREVAVEGFYLSPGATPERETRLAPGELITEVVVPALPWARTSTYVKVRDRSSYEFALCSVAAALDVRDGVVADVRLAAGGVATRPWRLREVEDALRGRPATASAFRAAAAAGVRGARPSEHNAFKLELLPRTVERALTGLAGRP